MHRGHSWVFRAESYDTMLAWYEDIKSLTEKSGEERNAFVRRHVRSVSQGSQRSVSSDGDGGLDEDEADEIPYSANHSMMNEAVRDVPQQRPSPGGRFPSDLQVDRHLQAPLSPSSGSSGDIDHDLTTAAGGLQGSYPDARDAPVNSELSHPQPIRQHQTVFSPYDGQNDNPISGGAASYQPPTQYPQTPYPTSSNAFPTAYQPQAPQPYSQPSSSIPPTQPTIERHASNYGDWMGPAAGGVAAGALGATAYRHHQQDQPTEPEAPNAPATQETAAPVSELQAPVTQEPVTSTAYVSTSAPTWVPITEAPSELASATSISTIPTSVSTEPAPSLSLGEAEAAEAAPAAASDTVTKSPSFPSILRNNTDISVSDLHVPGEYPKGPKAAVS
jgi:hypothetical protein